MVITLKDKNGRTHYEAHAERPRSRSRDRYGTASGFERASASSGPILRPPPRSRREQARLDSREKIFPPKEPPREKLFSMRAIQQAESLSRKSNEEGAGVGDEEDHDTGINGAPEERPPSSSKKNPLRPLVSRKRRKSARDEEPRGPAGGSEADGGGGPENNSPKRILSSAGGSSSRSSAGGAPSGSSSAGGVSSADDDPPDGAPPAEKDPREPRSEGRVLRGGAAAAPPRAPASALSSSGESARSNVVRKGEVTVIAASGPAGSPNSLVSVSANSVLRSPSPPVVAGGSAMSVSAAAPGSGKAVVVSSAATFTASGAVLVAGTKTNAPAAKTISDGSLPKNTLSLDPLEKRGSSEEGRRKSSSVLSGVLVPRAAAEKSEIGAIFPSVSSSSGGDRSGPEEGPVVPGPSQASSHPGGPRPQPPLSAAPPPTPTGAFPSSSAAPPPTPTGAFPSNSNGSVSTGVVPPRQQPQQPLPSPGPPAQQGGGAQQAPQPPSASAAPASAPPSVSPTAVSTTSTLFELRDPAPSPPAYVEQSKRLIAQLNVDYPNEYGVGQERRRQVVTRLEELLNQWLRKVGPSDGVERKGKVRTMGSYTLGVISKHSDIDLVCICPQLPNFSYEEGVNTLREFFIKDFGDLLSSLPEVEDFVRIDSAANPTLNCTFSSIELDILFCDLPLRSVDHYTLKSSLERLDHDDILAGIDEPSARAVNAVRVALTLKQLVPDFERFRTVLRFVKCWGKRRGIYSNICGYCGGVTWAICVAKICLLYPNYCEAHLIVRFFIDMALWDWEGQALLLRPLSASPNVTDSSLLPQISLKHSFTGSFSHMAVVTPVFPYINSCHNVTENTKAVLHTQLFRASSMAKKVDQAIRGGKSFSEINDFVDWEEFYADIPFFSDYGRFVRVDVRTRSQQKHKVFRGLIESKLRYLLQALDQTEHLRAHLYPYDIPEDAGYNILLGEARRQALARREVERTASAAIARSGSACVAKSSTAMIPGTTAELLKENATSTIPLPIVDRPSANSSGPASLPSPTTGASPPSTVTNERPPLFDYDDLPIDLVRNDIQYPYASAWYIGLSFKAPKTWAARATGVLDIRAPITQWIDYVSPELLGVINSSRAPPACRLSFRCLAKDELPRSVHEWGDVLGARGAARSGAKDG